MFPTWMLWLRSVVSYREDSEYVVEDGWGERTGKDTGSSTHLPTIAYQLKGIEKTHTCQCQDAAHSYPVVKSPISERKSLWLVDLNLWYNNPVNYGGKDMKNAGHDLREKIGSSFLFSGGIIHSENTHITFHLAQPMWKNKKKPRPMLLILLPCVLASSISVLPLFPFATISYTSIHFVRNHRYVPKNVVKRTLPLPSTPSEECLPYANMLKAERREEKRREEK